MSNTFVTVFINLFLILVNKTTLVHLFMYVHSGLVKKLKIKYLNVLVNVKMNIN